MTSAGRQTLLGLLLALGLNHFVLGLFWIGKYTQATPIYIAFGLYLVALFLTLYSTTNLKLPKVIAYLVLLVCIVIPGLVLWQLPISTYSHSGSYETWFIAGTSLLLAITSARGYPGVGWIGLAYLWSIVVAWGGFPVVTTSGLIGALLMVMTAWAVGRGLRSTEEAAADYYRQAAEVQTRVAQNTASRDARHRIIQTVLFTGLPLLERIKDQDGQLSDADRAEARLLENRFRDEIQGRTLLSDGVRLATREARKRGVEVTFNDGGGLTGLADPELEIIHNSIANAIDSTQSGKINISSPAGETYRVRIIAQRPEASSPDLWLSLS